MAMRTFGRIGRRLARTTRVSVGTRRRVVDDAQSGNSGLSTASGRDDCGHDSIHSYREPLHPARAPCLENDLARRARRNRLIVKALNAQR